MTIRPPLFLVPLVMAVGASTGWGQTPPRPVQIGAKIFTESIILGHALGRLAEEAGVPADVRSLGGTPIVWNALRTGEIDAYVEYTGTLRFEIYDAEVATTEELTRRLEADGLVILDPLGFNNTYVLGLSPQFAERHPDVQSMSQLAELEGVRFGLSHEFLDRNDGWPGLVRAYGFEPGALRALNHDLAYRALVAGEIDAMEMYSTDGEIAYYELRTLLDDRHFFPDYEAVVLVRQELLESQPGVVEQWRRLSGQIDAATMSEMNAAVNIEKRREAVVAAEFLKDELGVEQRTVEASRAARIWRYTLEHLWLVGISLGMAILLAVPLGILAATHSRLGQPILGVVALVQTIPSLALLVLFIPLLGIGPAPAIAALFVYSLLPIVRNTHAGLVSIPTPTRESAIALGLTEGQRLRRVELPLAFGSILAGIKTAAVINVGTATLGGFIAAGGYGEPIFNGIRRDEAALLLEGAIPAALLALAIQGMFDLIESWSGKNRHARRRFSRKGREEPPT